MGEALAEEYPKYHVVQIERIKIYYPPKLKMKEGFTAIRVTLKKVLFAKWLEIDGAMGIVDKVKQNKQVRD